MTTENTVHYKYGQMLFKVVSHGEPIYFDDKMLAKRARNTTGADTVQRGPDHWRGET